MINQNLEHQKKHGPGSSESVFRECIQRVYSGMNDDGRPLICDLLALAHAVIKGTTPKATPTPKPKPEPKPEPKSQLAPAPKPDSQPEPKSQPAPAPVPESQPAPAQAESQPAPVGVLSPLTPTPTSIIPTIPSDSEAETEIFWTPDS